MRFKTMKGISVLLAITVVLALVPLMGAGPASAAVDWTRIASGGIDNNKLIGAAPFAQFQGELYVGIVPLGSFEATAPVWAYDGSRFRKSGVAGFGDPDNTWTFPNTVYKGYLYCGTDNENGGELWRTSDGNTWEQIRNNGFGDKESKGCLPLGVQEGKLIVGFYNETSGAKVYSFDGSKWTRANTDGFGDGYTDMSFGASYKGNIYIAGLDQVNDDFRMLRYDGGKSWTPVSELNFGNNQNEEVRALTTDGEFLYVGTLNMQGAELWSYDGKGWTRIGSKGLGNSSNQMLFPNAGEGTLYVGSICIAGNKPGRLYRRKYDGSFEQIADPGFGVNMNAAILGAAPFAGKLVACTANTNGFQVWTAPAQPPDTYYFAEGTTRSNAQDGIYQEWISVENPNDSATEVTVTYMFSAGDSLTKDYTVDPSSRLTVDVAADVGLDKDVSVKVVGEQPIVAERPIYFDYKNKWTGGHVVMGVPMPRSQYYFAEGTTRANPVDGYFEEWLCVLNPGGDDAQVDVTYMLGTGETIPRSYTVEGNRRRTIDVNTEIGPDKDVSILVECDTPVVAERPMYFNYHGTVPGGHDVVGATGTSETIYFAEGTTRSWAQEWLCIQNPGTQQATVTLTYLVAGEGKVTQTVPVEPTSRNTVSVAAAVGLEKDVSVSLESDVPVVAERPMYFNYQDKWPGGHDVMGSPSAYNRFYFAEGTTRWNSADGYFDEWLCLQNPGDTQASVDVTFMRTDGVNIGHHVDIGPEERVTLSANAILGPDVDAAIMVVSDVPVVAERPMYFDYHGFATGGHDTLGLGI